MISYLILTNTYIDYQSLQKIVAATFFNSKNQLLNLDISLKEIDQNLYHQKQNTGQIIEINIDKKDIEMKRKTNLSGIIL
jgi:hypothetical protein